MQVKVVRENFQEDAEDNLPDSRNQSHLIGKLIH